MKPGFLNLKTSDLTEEELRIFYAYRSPGEVFVHIANLPDAIEREWDRFFFECPLFEELKQHLEFFPYAYETVIKEQRPVEAFEFWHGLRDSATKIRSRDQAKAWIKSALCDPCPETQRYLTENRVCLVQAAMHFALQSARYHTDEALHAHLRGTPLLALHEAFGQTTSDRVKLFAKLVQETRREVGLCSEDETEEDDEDDDDQEQQVMRTPFDIHMDVLESATLVCDKDQLVAVSDVAVVLCQLLHEQISIWRHEGGRLDPKALQQVQSTSLQMLALLDRTKMAAEDQFPDTAGLEPAYAAALLLARFYIPFLRGALEQAITLADAIHAHDSNAACQQRPCYHPPMEPPGLSITTSLELLRSETLLWQTISRQDEVQLWRTCFSMAVDNRLYFPADEDWQQLDPWFFTMFEGARPDLYAQFHREMDDVAKAINEQKLYSACVCVFRRSRRPGASSSAGCPGCRGCDRVPGASTRPASPRSRRRSR